MAVIPSVLFAVWLLTKTFEKFFHAGKPGQGATINLDGLGGIDINHRRQQPFGQIGKAVRGGVATMTTQGIFFVLNIVSTAVLARLLTPEDFGLIAMVTVVTGFMGIFKDLGLSMATVQQDRINQGQISALFWINTALSVVLALVMAALAVPISWFYHEPRLVHITLLFALTTPLSGLAIQHQALLRRQMHFTAIGVINTLALVAGIVLAIAMASWGSGYWALVAMPIARTAVMTAGYWLASGWRPGRPVKGSGVRAMLSFGGYLSGFNVVNYFARNLDNVLIGKFIGSESLGFYSRAYSLLMLPIRQINAPVTAVAIPVLSRLADSPDRYRAYYRQGVMLMSMLTMPIVVFSFVATQELVMIALGPQWLDAVPIFRALAPAAFIGIFHGATGWVYISRGQTDRQFRISVIWTVIIIVCFVIGLQWGAVGVAAFYSISQAIIILPGFIYCFHGTPLVMRDIGIALWRPALASIGAGIAVFYLDRNIVFDNNIIINVLAKLIFYTLAYTLMWGVQPGGIKVIFTAVRHLKGECA